MLRNPRYVIAVKNLSQSARFYRDVLGFEIITIPDPGWLFFVKDDCFIMAGECAEALSPRELGDHSYFAYVEVDDIQRYHDVVVANGAEIMKTLRPEPWGMTEFGIRTADGHRMMFGQPSEQAAG